ncbi:hypothetical protein KUTeg_017949 [Tegillarca granosa]|uniref:Uncharacterized protein n=1 Tax=Tegillarca granosa TaxID=220873 RepID=A0ABQ9EIW6_TEGGR|nr:hypothetical protein KUTeg_017949 [Tegillarca granosa]
MKAAYLTLPHKRTCFNNIGNYYRQIFILICNVDLLHMADKLCCCRKRQVLRIEYRSDKFSKVQTKFFHELQSCLPFSRYFFHCFCSKAKNIHFCKLMVHMSQFNYLTA